MLNLHKKEHGYGLWKRQKRWSRGFRGGGVRNDSAGGIKEIEKGANFPKGERKAKKETVPTINARIQNDQRRVR